MGAVEEAYGFCPVGTISLEPHNHELCLRMWPPTAVEEWQGREVMVSPERPVIEVKLYEGAPMPPAKYPGDGGLDLTATQGAHIRVGETRKVELGVAVALPEGYCAFLMGRSSMFGKGLLVMQTLIDQGYRGELFAIVYNFGRKNQSIQAGDRIAQLVPVKSDLSRMVMRVVPQLPTSERGGNGFGSSGR